MYDAQSAHHSCNNADMEYIFKTTLSVMITRTKNTQVVSCSKKKARIRTRKGLPPIITDLFDLSPLNKRPRFDASQVLATYDRKMSPCDHSSGTAFTGRHQVAEISEASVALCS